MVTPPPPRDPSGGSPRKTSESASPREIRLGASTILVASGLLARTGEIVRRFAPAHRYVLITDSNVGPLYAKMVGDQLEKGSAEVLTIPAGESNKTRETWARLTDQMLAKRYGRDSAVIALGGGVVGDLAGFVAATYMRGIPVVQVPTTLVAMVDASIGGKTAVDTPAGKNLVGIFHPPAAVLTDPQVLGTLPLKEMRAGFAEIVKHGVIADEPYLRLVASSASEMLSGTTGSTSDRMLSLIVRSMEIKADIVSRDEREEGLRKTLNFGHTIGHAVELVSGYSLLHGEAVAIGMALESRLAELIGVAQTGTAATITKALQSAGLQTDLPPGIEPDAVIEAMRSDKKGVSGKTRLALPLRVGAMAAAETGWTVPVGDDQLREVLHENQQNLSAYPRSEGR
ncbi:MAG TPA: 3-dehydroquinate synthase [Gemmatimonadaceae bacterium]|nr:3-dehydroquinate synthase [Gemmatimonadaceae bacterium]